MNEVITGVREYSWEKSEEIKTILNKFVNSIENLSDYVSTELVTRQPYLVAGVEKGWPSRMRIIYAKIVRSRILPKSSPYMVSFVGPVEI